MASEGTEHHGDAAPLILIGYAAIMLPELGKFLPDRSVVFVEEPDVIRKRSLWATTTSSPKLRELIEWDYQLDGAADCFYHRYRDLRPAAVVPVSDYGVPFAGRLAERYGVRGAGYGAALLLRDKHLLRRVTAAAGIANPPSVMVTGPEQVKAFMADINGPIVLKPANRRASVGTKIVADPSEVESSWVETLDQDEGVFAPDRMPIRMLAERFVRGDEYSVEMMRVDGRSGFAGVTRKFLFDGPRPVEEGHLHPADIAPELTGRLIADTTRVLDAVGMDSGFVHCEWIVESGQPYLVECAGRMAGDGIIELARLAWGYDLVEQFYRMMQGQPLTAEPPPAPPGFAAAWLPHAAPGRVESVAGVEDARSVPGVHTCAVSVVPGDEIHPLRSSWDRVAVVITEARSATEALGNARLAASRIAITVRPG